MLHADKIIDISFAFLRDYAEKADRIAIMVNGRIECSGQPQFLKKR